MIGDPIALRIRRNIERAPQDLLKRFEDVETSFIADAQQGWNCMHHSIRPLHAADRFVGTAITASGGPRDNLAAMAVLDFVQPGDVLVLATGGDDSGAVVGDLWSSIARQKGVVGVVTDGLVRDVDGILKQGAPTFAAGASPNAGYANGPGEINLPVSVGGVAIEAGDIVIADRNGVVVVPRGQAESIATALEHVIEAEATTEKKVANGEVDTLWDASKFADRGVQFVD